MVRCTRTAMSILAGAVRATSPSIPAVLRPALRCVARRTLTSVLLQLRSISFCRLLALARSPSWTALKIRCRSRRTLSSWAGQLRASQPGTASSGPFACRAAFTSAAAGVTLTSATAGVTQAPPSHTGVVKL